MRSSGHQNCSLRPVDTRLPVVGPINSGGRPVDPRALVARRRIRVAAAERLLNQPRPSHIANTTIVVIAISLAVGQSSSFVSGAGRAGDLSGGLR